MGRVLPNYKKEILNMAGDKTKYDEACQELVNVLINKNAIDSRVKDTQVDYDKIQVKEEAKFKMVMEELGVLKEKEKSKDSY